MTITISASQLAEFIQNMLSDYGGQISVIVSEQAKTAAKNTVKQLKRSSPALTGAYGKSWRYKVQRGTYGEPDSYIVYNDKHYRLTHLLEYGHSNANGTGRTQAKPHIAKAEADMIDTYVESVARAVNAIT